MSDLGAGQPPRGIAGQSRLAARPVGRQRVAQPSGWWGFVLFLCSEVTIFGSLFGTYYYLDFRVRHWPPDGIAPPKVTATAVITGVLVLTVPMLWAAVRCARRGERGRAIAWVVMGLVIQAGFLGVQIDLFVADLARFRPDGSAYGSIYYTLLAAHDAHVLFGLVLSLAIIYKLWRHGVDDYWMTGLRGLALYWYVVAALAVVVLFVLLTPSL